MPSLCAVEAHPGLHHLVSTVRGTLRPDVGLGTLLAATLPPASVTGAPKPRVLQVIEELEPVRRGVYCGAFGWIDTEHREADLAVAIRTFTVFPDRTELGVGAGIVADSSPVAGVGGDGAEGVAPPRGRGRRRAGAVVSFVWVNGQLTAADDARVSPFDHGLLVGDGVFETHARLRRRAVRVAPPPRPAGPLGPRPRPRSRPTRALLADAGDAVLAANRPPARRGCGSRSPAACSRSVRSGGTPSRP